MRAARQFCGAVADAACIVFGMLLPLAIGAACAAIAAAMGY